MVWGIKMLKTIVAVVVKDPKISAKMLCEYAEASALTRRSILQSCKIKDPRVIAISKRYNQATDLIADCLEFSFEYLEVLKDYAKDLRKNSKTQVGKNAESTLLCAEALDQFYNLESQLHSLLDKFVMNNTINSKSRRLSLNRVNVSIRPEIMLSIDAGETEIGFIKLCFCKSKPLTASIAQGIAALGRFYFSSVKEKYFKPENCLVIDVFANKIFIAPKNDKRTLMLLNACCMEIADRWDKI